MPTIAYSARDPAGTRMAEWFKENGFKEREPLAGLPCWEKNGVSLVETGEKTIDFSTRLKTDLLVFASKHSSASEKPCLTAHFTGNWGPGQHGGSEKELSFAAPGALKAAYEFLLSEPVPGFPVFLEATHHGPTSLSCPVLFVEVGSSPEQWGDEAACQAVARACLKACNAPKAKECVLGFGGGHYCPKFSELEKSFLFSHVCPKYALRFLSGKTLKQATQKAGAPVKKAFVDKKGCGGEKARLLSLLEGEGLEYENV